MPTVNIQLDKFRTKKQQKLIAMLKDKNVLKEANKIILDEINNFVPLGETGKLRKSAIVTHKSITWGRNIKYARYQYGGIVYGPNFPGAINGEPVWRSPKGEGSKYPTGREIGAYNGVVYLRPKWQKGEPTVDGLLPYKLGYTTQGTHHHWDEYFKYGPKQKANLEITRMLRQECKNRGLKT